MRQTWGHGRRASQPQEIKNPDFGAPGLLRTLRGGRYRRYRYSKRSSPHAKGEAHYAREADAIVDRCEAERIVQHRDLEALKERQFAAAQQSRLRQAQERKGIAELHRMERQQLGQAHERSRGREIDVSQRAFVRTGQRGVSQHAFERAAGRKEQTQEQAHGWSRGLSR